MGEFKRTKKDIIVLGSGIVGLTCALVLCETGFNVRIFADKLPTDIPDTSYTSPWAGAHFRPFPSRTESDKNEAALTRITLRYFEALARSEPESSVRFVEGIEYFELPDEPYLKLNGGYSEGIEGFQKLHKDQLPVGVKFGTKYRTWVLNAPYYLKYL